MFYLVIKFVAAGAILGYAWTPTGFATKADCEADAEKLSQEVYENLRETKKLPEDENIEVFTMCTQEKPK